MYLQILILGFYVERSKNTQVVHNQNIMIGYVAWKITDITVLRTCFIF